MTNRPGGSMGRLRLGGMSKVTKIVIPLSYSDAWTLADEAIHGAGIPVGIAITHLLMRVDVAAREHAWAAEKARDAAKAEA